MAGNECVLDEPNLAKLKPTLVRERDDKPRVPQPEPPTANEFGLPPQLPRRRQLSLSQLSNPEIVKGAEHRESQDGKTGEVARVQPEDGQDASTYAENVEALDEADKGSGIPEPAAVSEVKPTKEATSEWSHQQLAAKDDVKEDESDGEWQDMPAYTEYRTYDDWGKILARGYDEMEDETVAYGQLGGAGKGYTRVQMDEDAQSSTSMDKQTSYLFKDQYARHALDADDEEGRDLASQMQTTKQLLTEAQKYAYVAAVRLAINEMSRDVQALEKIKGKGSKKAVELASEGLKLWGQKTMLQLYTHMSISAQEQVMVEQLAEHDLRLVDLTPTLMQNSRVKNPQSSKQDPASPDSPSADFTEQSADNLTIQDASELTSSTIDIDIRWTVLCDLFLLMLKDGQYDARSRTLFERVGKALAVDWQEICRFEKRVTDALEMQEQAHTENWNEDEHLKSREESARKKRLVVMGLCTVGGGLVIGLSAGMLAPVIGAGLAAGFTTIGVTGTGTFLGGTGAAALIGTTGSLIGGHIGIKGASRRTGAVKTFQYVPLYNNKRVNLIVTISGWTTGKVDDVRLPFSTVNPIMGDIYSVNWEPEMLQSTGETIQILGTEALTQTIQQILGATFLATLMAGLSLPIVLTKLAYLIDNPWTVSLARADAAGLVLADSLLDRDLGVRPITLVGFSLGSRVIFSCLKEVARRGGLGLVQNVYLFGSPVVVKKDEWLNARAVVSGRFVNGYATNDWILAYLFRATSGGVMRVAGLSTVDIVGVEDINVTEHVPGHMAYRGMMPTLLHEVGWQVDSVEFGEIEDPDPDNHAQRQRELLREIEDARHKLEEKPEKKGWRGIFGRKKAAQKQAWEMYDERSQQVLRGENAQESERVAAENADVMFDVEAIQREALRLATEGEDWEEIKSHISVRQIESTLPALKLSSKSTPLVHSRSGSPAATFRAGSPVTNFQTGSPATALRSGSPANAFRSSSPVTTSRRCNSPGGVSFHSTRDSMHTPPVMSSPISSNQFQTHHNPWAADDNEEVEMTFE